MNLQEELFLAQARSDYAIYKTLVDRDICHRLHYLQMSTEKLGKAYFWRNGSFPGFGHHKFEPFLRALEHRPDFHKLFGLNDERRFEHLKSSIFRLAMNLQLLAPAHGNSGPNPEYPWPPLSPSTGPLMHSFTEWENWSDSLPGNHLKYCVENLLDNYATIFP